MLDEAKKSVIDDDGKFKDVDSSLGRITVADGHWDVAACVRENVKVAGLVCGDCVASGALACNDIKDSIVDDDYDAIV